MKRWKAVEVLRRKSCQENIFSSLLGTVKNMLAQKLIMFLMTLLAFPVPQLTTRSWSRNLASSCAFTMPWAKSIPATMRSILGLLPLQVFYPGRALFVMQRFLQKRKTASAGMSPASRRKGIAAGINAAGREFGFEWSLGVYGKHASRSFCRSPFLQRRPHLV